MATRRRDNRVSGPRKQLTKSGIVLRIGFSTRTHRAFFWNEAICQRYHTSISQLKTYPLLISCAYNGSYYKPQLAHLQPLAVSRGQKIMIYLYIGPSYPRAFRFVKEDASNYSYYFFCELLACNTGNSNCRHPNWRLVSWYHRTFRPRVFSKYPFWPKHSW